jgi:hypothetical protein
LGFLQRRKNGTSKRNNTEIRRDSEEDKSGDSLGTGWAHAHAGNSRPQTMGYEVIEDICAFLCAIL